MNPFLTTVALLCILTSLFHNHEVLLKCKHGYPSKITEKFEIDIVTVYFWIIWWLMYIFDFWGNSMLTFVILLLSWYATIGLSKEDGKGYGIRYNPEKQVTHTQINLSHSVNDMYILAIVCLWFALFSWT